MLSTFVIGVVLFVYSGISQNFPWGVPTAQIVSCASESPELFMSDSNVETFGATEIVQPEFDDVFVDKISTLTTDRSFSWIISTDIANYKPTIYLLREALTQFFVAFFLSLILAITDGFSSRKRLTLILIAALSGIFATGIQQMNWWHVPASYQLGMALNVILGWLLAAFISMTWIIKRQTS